MNISIPGRGALVLDHLVMDYNGTLAVDGMLIQGVKDLLAQLSGRMKLHVITADTFGRAKAGLSDIDCELTVLPQADQQVEKLAYIRRIGAERTASIGNGRNDRLMLKESALGIALILKEGGAMETLLSADVVCTSIIDALELLTHPLRLVATLRT